MARLQGISSNLNAFLDMIAFSEGTADLGDDGYNIIVGGSTFHDYSKHPGLPVRLNRKLVSTAAGRYQILYRYALYYQKKLGLKDFSPASQDKIAIQYIREKGALSDIEAGRIQLAISKCSSVWASFPGNSYGQRSHPVSVLLAVFNESTRRVA